MILYLGVIAIIILIAYLIYDLSKSRELPNSKI